MSEQGIDDRTRLLDISERAKHQKDEEFEDEWPHRKEAFLKELKAHARKTGETQMQVAIGKSRLEGNLDEFCKRFREETGISVSHMSSTKRIYFNWGKEIL